MKKDTILLVDDEGDIRELLQTLLEPEFPGFKFVLGDSYGSGEKIAMENLDRISIAILDESIGGGGRGSDIALKMKAGGYKGGLISISGNDLKEREALFNKQFHKPFNLKKFPASVRQYMIE